MLTRADGTVLEVWGLPMDRGRCRRLARGVSNATIDAAAGELRVLSRQVEYAGHRYVAAVMAPLAPASRAARRDGARDVAGRRSLRCSWPPPAAG